MLIRVSGTLTDGRPFATRVEAPDLFAAVERASETLGNAGVTPTVLRAKALEGKSSLAIGKVRQPKEKKAKAATVPAKK